MSSIRQNSLATTSAVLIVTLCIFGWIYSKFPPGWYEPTDLGSMASNLVSHCLLAGVLPLTFPPIVIIACSALIVAYIRRPKELQRRHLSLLIPLAAAFPLCLWGGYWDQHEPLDANKSFVWMANINNELTNLLWTGILLSILLVAFSKSWKRERVFGLSLLTAECVYLSSLIFLVSVEMGNRLFR